MSTKSTKKKRFPSSIDEMTIDQLITLVDRRIAGGEIPWPLRPGGEVPWPLNPRPWPFPIPSPEPPWGPEPWPPYCPVCRKNGQIRTSNMMAADVSFATERTRRSISTDQIWIELKEALEDWKDRFGTVTQSTKLASMAASGDGRYDVLSAVARSRFFNALGLVLHYFHIGGDEKLSDVVETVGRLLEDLGHVVQS